MEWLTCIRTAIDYIERHLTEDIRAQEIAERVYLSPFFFQKGFSLMTGYGMSEYVRNRRLYQAALDLKETDDKVIDIALRYGYETPESFAKAFSRFHGASPSQVRAGAPIRVFLPLKIQIRIQGGDQMNCTIQTIGPIRVIGFERIFDMESSYAEIPKYWTEIFKTYGNGKNSPENPYEKAIRENGIGEYGVCIDDIGGGKFRYLIAGAYKGGFVPEGMTVYTLPESDWAVFDCVGPIPETLQKVNTQIFREWLPGNAEYELCGSANIEWYSADGRTTDPDYHSAIWVPVKKK